MLLVERARMRLSGRAVCLRKNQGIRLASRTTRAEAGMLISGVNITRR